MDQLVKTLVSLFFTAIGLWAFIAVFVAKYRMQWKGTQVTAGICSHLGIALVFVCAGSIVLLIAPGDKVFPLQAFFLIAGVVFVAFWSICGLSSIAATYNFGLTNAVKIRWNT